MTMPHLLSTAALCATLLGCAGDPQRYQPPKVALPDSFRAAGVQASGAADDRWWQGFGDAGLDALVERAVGGNLDLAAATSRIAAARAARGVARAASFPTLDAQARVGREQLSRNSLIGSAAGAAIPETYTLSRVGVDASWELDLFGAHAAERRKAQAQHLDASAEHAAVRLSVAAEVTRLYIENLITVQRLASAQRVVELRQQTLSLIERQWQAGEVPAISVARARQNLQLAVGGMAPLAAERQALGHAMGVLLGTAEWIDLPITSPLLAVDGEAMRLTGAVHTGLPSDLLQRRPDIQRAEAAYRVAVADLDIARADRFPRFSLVSTLGLESIEQGSLFESASRYWSAAPQLTLPLFDGGRRKATRAVRHAQLEEATARYQQAVIGALGDVEQALLRQRGAAQSLSASLAALDAADEVQRLEISRHIEGESSMLQRLEARSQYESALQSTLAARESALVSFVTLHKSLGGQI